MTVNWNLVHAVLVNIFQTTCVQSTWLRENCGGGTWLRENCGGGTRIMADAGPAVEATAPTPPIRDRLTVVVTTSPIPSNPSTAMIDALFDSFAKCPGLVSGSSPSVMVCWHSVHVWVHVGGWARTGYKCDCAWMWTQLCVGGCTKIMLGCLYESTTICGTDGCLTATLCALGICMHVC